MYTGRCILRRDQCRLQVILGNFTKNSASRTVRMCRSNIIWGIRIMGVVSRAAADNNLMNMYRTNIADSLRSWRGPQRKQIDCVISVSKPKSLEKKVREKWLQGTNDKKSGGDPENRKDIYLNYFYSGEYIALFANINKFTFPNFSSSTFLSFLPVPFMYLWKCHVPLGIQIGYRRSREESVFQTPLQRLARSRSGSLRWRLFIRSREREREREV